MMSETANVGGDELYLHKKSIVDGHVEGEVNRRLSSCTARNKLLKYIAKN